MTAQPAQAPDSGVHVREGDMTPVEVHMSQILTAIRALPPTELALADAEGCVLAEDVTAAVPLPSFDNSSMDGYAVLARDTAKASDESPASLPVTGEIAAGDTGALTLVAGTAIRIMTGAQMPSGADAVVPVELTDGGITRVAIRREVASGAAVRYAGEDARQGEVLLAKGTRLKPMHIAVAASAGRPTCLGAAPAEGRGAVHRQRAGQPGTPLVPGRIWDSNSYMIAAAAREAGAIAYRHAIVPDDPAEVLPRWRSNCSAPTSGHHRRGQHGRRARRGEGGAQPTGHGHLPKGGDAARDAAGVRNGRR